jgi:YD repeat-containing protein
MPADGNGNTVSFTYDDAGRVTATTDALGNTSTTTYDNAGNVLTTTDWEGRSGMVGCADGIKDSRGDG